MTDADLARLAAGGDHESFEMLYAKYRAFVERCAMHFTRRGEAFAEDIAQETWVALIDGRWQLERDADGGTLHKFLYAMSRYVTWRFRDASHPTVRFIPLGVGIAACLAAIHHDPVSKLIDDEQAAVLRWAVAALSQRDRALLTLRYRDGLTVRALGERDGRSMQTVAEDLARIHRRVAAACGVPYIPVRRGRYPRDVAHTSRPPGRRTLTPADQCRLQAARRSRHQEAWA